MHPAVIPSFGLLAAAYLCGSVPFGLLIARAKGIDIRKQGSGNIGATNVGRVLGRKWGVLCFFLDFLKGLIPSVIAGFVLRGPLSGDLEPAQASVVWLSVAVAAVLGHMFPVWIGFKGGKGVATGFGAMLGVYPVFTLGAVAAIVVWAIVLKLTRLMGVASVVGAWILAVVVIAAWLGGEAVARAMGWLPGFRAATGVEAGFAVGLAALVTFKHRGNIARTIAGTEPRVGGGKARGAGV